MYYGALKKTDTANGLGVRVTLFVSGCTNCCKGCFQQETWDFGYGQPYSAKTQIEILDDANAILGTKNSDQDLYDQLDKTSEYKFIISNKRK